MPLRPKMDLREFSALFLRRKWIVIFSVLSILFTASVYCVVTPELYKSGITILIIPQTVPEDYVRSTISLRVEQQLATIRQQVMSRTTLTNVMDELGLFEKERKKMTSEDLFALVRKRVEIEVVRGQGGGGNNAFSLSFLHEDPRLAMRTAAKLAAYFIEENLKAREQQAVGTSDFLESQLKETKARLEVMEQRVRNYKMRFMGELPQQTDANLRLLAGLQDRLRTNENNTRSAEERQAFLEAQINLMAKSLPAASSGKGKTGPVVYRDPNQSLAAELARKRERLADLSARYTEKVPEVASAKAEVEDLERQLAEAQRAAAKMTAEDPDAGSPEPAVANPMAIEESRQIRARLKSGAVEIAALRKEREEIRKSIAAVEQRVEKSPRREQEMIAMVRDYENQKLSYDDLQRKKLEADVSQNLEKRQKGTQFQILDPANLPEEPIRPNRRKVMGVSLLLALTFGFGAVIVLEMVDLRLRDVSDFRQLYKVPILGYIPVLQGQEHLRAKAMRRAAVLGGLVTLTMAFSIFLLVYRDKIRTILNF